MDWFKILSLGGTKTVIKSWFGGAGCSVSHSILDLLSWFVVVVAVLPNNNVYEDCELLWEKNHVFHLLSSSS